MRRAAILLLAAAGLAAADAPPVLKAQDLPKVPGPLTSRFTHQPRYQDPAALGAGRDDLQLRIRDSARNGGSSIPAVGLPSGSVHVAGDAVGIVAGWKAYRVDVPVGTSVHFRLRSAHEGWFRVRAANKWGDLGPGMLQNIISTGNPEASYKNPGKAQETIYFVVDTSELSAQNENYDLDVTWS